MLYLCGNVDVVDGGGIQVDSVKALVGAVKHLQSGVLLHRQVDHQRCVTKLAKRLKSFVH